MKGIFGHSYWRCQFAACSQRRRCTGYFFVEDVHVNHVHVAIFCVSPLLRCNPLLGTCVLCFLSKLLTHISVCHACLTIVMLMLLNHTGCSQNQGVFVKMEGLGFDFF